jgi:polyisoprenoid-binding protein YceI
MNKLFVKKAGFMGVLVMGMMGCLQAAHYEIDQAHSEVGFRIRHIVSRVRGRFDSFSGTIDFDEKNPITTAADVTIKTASINTNNEKRDQHLKSPDFFNAEKFPEMTFKTTKFIGTTKLGPTGEGELQMIGELTLLGVTKPVTLDITMRGTANDAKSRTHAGFSASGKLNRKDFGMTYNKVMDSGGVMLGDEVELLIEIEAVQTK